MPQNKSNLDLNSFTNLVQPLLDKIETYPEGSFHISDVVDKHGKQYVNLVQEGGGVHGIALTGYTYVLEKMGIAFYKMAGTSAGSINTLLLSGVMTEEEYQTLSGKQNHGYEPKVTGQYYDTRSEKLLEYLVKKDIGDFMDGHNKWIYLIRSIFSSNKGSSKGIVYWGTILGIILLGLLGLSQISIFLSMFDVIIPDWLKWICGIFGILIFLVLLFTYYIRNLWLVSKRFGIHPGDNFQEWAKSCLDQNNLSNISNLKAKLQLESNKLELKHKGLLSNVDDAIELKKQLALVSADITNQIKVSFPGDHKLYWGDNFEISPACYLRASMSVPFFFEPYRIDPADQIQIIKDYWKTRYKLNIELEDPFYLVDGGLLSNFPMDIFYKNENTQIVPTFGIKLAYDNPLEFGSTFKFAGNIISSMRMFYDNGFVIKNNIFKQTIRTIDVGDVHWLNFNMTVNEQKELFIRGTLTACIFINNILGNPNISTKDLVEIGVDIINSVRPLKDKIEHFEYYDGLDRFDWNKYKQNSEEQKEDLHKENEIFNKEGSFNSKYVHKTINKVQTNININNKS